MQDYTSIRVTKEVHQQLQGYADSCYDGLSLTAVLGQLLADLGEGHVRFPEYGLFQCPAHRREQLRAAVGALSAARVRYPSSVKISCIKLLISGSSSIMRIVFWFVFIFYF